MANPTTTTTTNTGSTKGERAFTAATKASIELEFIRPIARKIAEVTGRALPDWALRPDKVQAMFHSIPPTAAAFLEMVFPDAGRLGDIKRSYVEPLFGELIQEYFVHLQELYAGTPEQALKRARERGAEVVSNVNKKTACLIDQSGFVHRAHCGRISGIQPKLLRPIELYDAIDHHVPVSCECMGVTVARLTAPQPNESPKEEKCRSAAEALAPAVVTDQHVRDAIAEDAEWYDQITPEQRELVDATICSDLDGRKEYVGLMSMPRAARLSRLNSLKNHSSWNKLKTVLAGVRGEAHTGTDGILEAFHTMGTQIRKFDATAAALISGERRNQEPDTRSQFRRAWDWLKDAVSL